MTAAGVPAGWYHDPSTRHEQRYWDGGQWSSHVLDGPVSGEDVLVDQSFMSAVRYMPGVGYRAYRFPAWRWLVFILALIVVASAPGLLLMAFVLTQALGPTPSATEQWIFYWIYQPVRFGGTIGAPPTLLWVGLLLALATIGVSITSRQTTLMKAGGKVARLWSSKADKQRWRAGLDAMSAARVNLTIGYRLRDRSLLALGAIGSLLVLAIGANTIASRYGFSPTGTLETGLRLGLGPWLCLAAGICGVLAVVVALPWRLGREIVIYPNGRVSDIAPVAKPVDAAPRTPQAVTGNEPPTIAEIVEAAAVESTKAAESEDALRLAALREFALSSKTPGQMARRVGLAPAPLDALVARRGLKFSSGATSGNTYTGSDKLAWAANKEQLFDDLVSEKGRAGVLEQAKSVTPDWFNTSGGQLVANLADLGGLGMSFASKDRTPIPANERRLAWIGLIVVAGLIGVTFGLAAPVGWLWQSSYFGWRSGSKAEPRAAAALGLIGLLPVVVVLVVFVFGLVLAPIGILIDALT